MKKKILLVFMLIILCTLAFGAISASAYTEGIYTYSVSGGNAKITDCDASASGEIVIPATLGGYPVTSIGNYAFSGCNSLISVTIPDSVTSIGNYAFQKCTGLTSITIGGSVTYIGRYAFSGCTGLTSVSIPEGVTGIGDYAFYECDGLTSVSIGGSVTRIGVYAFCYCDGLTRVDITDLEAWCGIKFGNEYANPLCYAKKLYLNGNPVTSVTIPESVTSIGAWAFYRCNGLTRVDITNLEAWCDIEFGNEYANPLCSGKNLYLNGNLVTNLIIPDSVTSIGTYAFRGCTSLASVSVGSGVELIPENAFYGCKNLKGVCLPEELKYIRNDAFNGCSAIELVFYAGNETQWNEILFYSRNESLTNAKVVYNAEKKTYSFETNCDATLDDITDYAVFDFPTVENDGATLTGWYDNEELTGDAVTFPYYGDETVLYAAWTDRAGKSFDDAFVVEANCEYPITITESGQIVYFEFVPTQTKEYSFYSTGSKDTYGYLYNSNQSQLTYDDDDGDGNNFYITYNLTAGETYYITTKLYNGTGTFIFVVEQPVDYRINSVTIKDMQGNELTQIPEGVFLATISFTNISASEDAVIVLAQYTSSGEFKGLMYVQTEDVPQGSTMKLSIPVNNAEGEVAKLEAFCWESFSSMTPLGDAVEFSGE